MSQNALFLARLTAMKHGRQPQRAAVAGYLLGMKMLGKHFQPAGVA